MATPNFNEALPPSSSQSISWSSYFFLNIVHADLTDSLLPLQIIVDGLTLSSTALSHISLRRHTVNGMSFGVALGVRIGHHVE